MFDFRFGGCHLEFGLPVRWNRFEGNIVRFPIPENMVKEFETEFLSGLQAELLGFYVIYRVFPVLESPS